MNSNKTDVLMAMFGDEKFTMSFIFKGDNDNIWLDQWNATVVYSEKYFPDIEKAKGKLINDFFSCLTATVTAFIIILQLICQDFS